MKTELEAPNEGKIVEVFDMSYDGSGVAKLGGKVFFVAKALPNEPVRAIVCKEKNKFLYGRAVEVIQKSPLRVDAPCPYFEVCGGCDFQHCSYNSELSFKQKTLQKEFSKVGWQNEIKIVKSPKRFSYRNKIKFECEENRLGFFEAKSHTFFEAKKCLLGNEKVENSFEIVQEFLKENTLENLKNVIIKNVQNQTAICFLFDAKMKQNLEKFKKIVKKSQKFTQFFVFFAFGEVLESDKTRIFPLENENEKSPKMRRDFSTFSSPVEMSAFEQVNDDVAKILYDHMLSLADGKRIVNAYAGQGVLTRLAAEQAEFVYGIEYQIAAHESAQKLCEDVDNVQCICGKVEDILPEIFDRDKIGLVILDPPRSGCDERALRAISKALPEKIAYCSCNPATLVRDLRILQNSFKIDDVLAFDMFPCTANVETVVQLSRL